VSNQRGFTLIEMLLSVSIIAMLVGLSVPVYASFVGRNDLDVTRQGIVESLRRAQVYARAVEGDSTWGVAIVSGKAVVFKGASYAARDTAFDENIIINSTITPSGLGEVVFAKLSGAPSTSGTATLTQTTNNESRTVTINAKGMVE
jgi:prepilin-type N-terminal cleavage/methylation domain-containing protein